MQSIFCSNQIQNWLDWFANQWVPEYYEEEPPAGEPYCLDSLEVYWDDPL